MAVLGVVAGGLAARKQSDAYLLALVVAGPLALAMLGDRAFAALVVLVCVLPWYPWVSEAAEPPIVRQKVLCAAIAAAPLAPWLWSLAVGGRRTAPNRFALLLGVTYVGLTVLIYSTLGGVSEMIDSKIVGFLLLGVTFLCARRFGRAPGWPAAAFYGLVVLLLEGLYAYAKAPSQRVGSFSGYAITYGGLLAALLPLALVYAYRRSRLLAGATAAATGALAILSQARSSWVAIAVMAVVLVIVQVRAGNVRALTALAASALLVIVLAAGTGLGGIVERRLSSNLTQSASYTHRAWSYDFALGKIRQQPVFGAGVVGYSAEESSRRTSIGAVDNGYLSITVDMGLFGLIAAFVPIGVAIAALARCLRLGVAPPRELGMALGIVGLAVVTIFYDSFYWAQMDLLLGALGGALSVSFPLIRRTAERPRRARRAGAARRIRLAT